MTHVLLVPTAAGNRIRSARRLLLTVLALQLGACATARSVGKAEDIVDDGKHNTVLLSYELVYDAFDRDRGTRSAAASLNCDGGGSGSGVSSCFKVELPFVGNEIDGSRSWNRFEKSAVQPYRVRYGQYRIDAASFRVRIGSRPEVDCFEDKKGRTHCSTRQVDEFANTGVPLPSPIDFSVTSGSGCYLGHVQVHVQGETVSDFTFEPAGDPLQLAGAVDGVTPALRQRVAQFVDRPCR